MDAGTMQERNRALTRRQFATGLCLGMLSVLPGCGGGVEESPSVAGPTVGTARPLAWDVVPEHTLALAPGETFDLADTLPAAVAKGGVFEVDPSGTPLPAGTTLAPTGLLTVSGSATGMASGLVFRYTPPA